MNKPIIEVNNLTKSYFLTHRQNYNTFRDSLADLVKKPFNVLTRKKPINKEVFLALENISFSVNEGERIGIIGKNGAGKSTLLKILSRITWPTRGQVILRGRIASLLEVGTGFHPELTGRENIFLNGSILGMSRNEIRKKFDEIVAFSEIENFLDLPVKRYSSGMFVRLAFAVAAHLDPEILIVDEVLAVGDAAFQKKCLGKMSDVSKQGRTIIFVSHNMLAISQLCNYAYCLDRGKIVNSGAVVPVIERYLKQSLDGIDVSQKFFQQDPNKEFQVLAIRLLNNLGKTTSDFSCDSPITIELDCHVNKKLPILWGRFIISRKDGTDIYEGFSTDCPVNPLDNLSPGNHKIHINIPPNILGHGEYAIYLSFTSPMGTNGKKIDEPGIVASFQLNDYNSSAGNSRRGYLSTPSNWIKKNN